MALLAMTPIEDRGAVSPEDATPPNDWALLELDDVMLEDVPAVAVWRDDGSDEETEIAIIGYPGGPGEWSDDVLVTPHLSDGYSVKRLSEGKPVLAGADETRAGMSGGGVFDRDGALLGLHRAASDRALERYLVGAGEIRRALEARGLSPASAGPFRRMSWWKGPFSPAQSDQDLAATVASQERLAPVRNCWSKVLSASDATFVEELQVVLGSEQTKKARIRLEESERQRRMEIDARQAELDACRKSLQALRTHIEVTSRAEPPRRPADPVTFGSPEDIAHALEEHSNRVSRYYREVEEQAKARAALPAKEREALDLTGRQASLESALAEARGRTARDVQASAEALEVARQGDISNGLTQLFGEISKLLEIRENAATCFLKLIGADRVLARLLSTTMLDADQRDRAERERAEAIAGFLESLEELGESLLAGVLGGLRALAEAEQAGKRDYDDLQRKLGDLPVAEIESRRKNGRKLLDPSIPEVPGFLGLELPEDVENVKKVVSDQISTIAFLESAVREELASSAEFDSELRSTVRPEMQRLEGIKNRAQSAKYLIEQTVGTLEFLSAGGNASVAELEDVCRDVSAEAEQWLGEEPLGYLEKLAATDFQSQAAEKLLQRHVSTLYLADRSALTERREAARTRQRELEEAKNQLSGLLDAVAASHRKRLARKAWFSVFPGVGLPLLFFAGKQIRALERLVASGHAAYRPLSPYTRRLSMRVALIAIGLAVLVCVPISVLAPILPGLVAFDTAAITNLLGGQVGVWTLRATAIMGALMALRNYWLARGLKADLGSGAEP